jgi:hypothetical protein
MPLAIDEETRQYIAKLKLPPPPKGYEYKPGALATYQEEYGQYFEQRTEATQRFLQQPKLAEHTRQIAAQRFQEARYRERLGESESFFESIGYPQFGGKYAPFEVPSGFKVWNITESEGKLQVQFRQLGATRRPFQQFLHELPYEAYLEGQQSYSVGFYTKLGYPQFGGKYEPFTIPEGYKVKGITKTLSGLEVSFETPSTKQYAIETPLNWVTQQRRQEYRVAPLVAPILWDIKVHGISERASDIVYQQAEAMQKYGKFYGFPKSVEGIRFFGGLVETGELTIETVLPHPLPPPARPFTTGRIGGLVAGNILIGYGIGKVLEPGLAPIEEWLSGVWSKSGFKQQLDFFIKEPLQQKIMEFEPEGVMGFSKIPTQEFEGSLKSPFSWIDRFLMKITGIKPTLNVGEVSVPVVETALGEAIPKGLPYTDIGWELTFAPKMSGIFITEPLAASESIIRRSLPVWFGLGKELIPSPIMQEPLSFKGGKEAKTLIPQQVTEPLGSFDKGIQDVNVRGLFSWRGWPTVRELMEQQKLLPFVTQTELTRFGIHPYIPTFELKRSELLPQIFGFGMAFLPKFDVYTKRQSQLKAVAFPTFSLFSIQRLKPGLKARSLSLMDITPILKAPQRERSILKPFAMASLKPMTSLKMQTIQIQTPSLKIPPFNLPNQPPKYQFPNLPRLPSFHIPKTERMNRNLFGKWFKRTHAMPTEKQIMRELGFSTGRRKHSTKRRSVRRRKR